MLAEHDVRAQSMGIADLPALSIVSPHLWGLLEALVVSVESDELSVKLGAMRFALVDSAL